MNFKLLCSIVLLQTTDAGFTGFPHGGNHWEYQPLVLQWSHNFTNIRGCVWSYMGQSHNADSTFISYGTKEGLEIKILGWELLDIKRPCAGGIMKKNSSKSDAGHYEMRVAASSLVRSERLSVGIISPNDRSVIIQTGSNVTKLIPFRDENKTVYLGSDWKCTVILNDKYPDDTCTSVHRIGRNPSEVICNRTIEFNLEADVMYAQISVNLDIVKTKPFVFYIERKGQAETYLDKRLLKTDSIAYYAMIAIAIFLLITLVVVGYLLYSKTRNEKRHVCNSATVHIESDDTSYLAVSSEPKSNIPTSSASEYGLKCDDEQNSLFSKWHTQEDSCENRDSGLHQAEEFVSDSEHQSLCEKWHTQKDSCGNRNSGLSQAEEFASDSEHQEAPNKEIIQLQRRLMRLERHMKLELDARGQALNLQESKTKRAFRRSNSSE